MTNKEKLWLKAETEAALIEALPFARGADKEGNSFWIGDKHAYSLDVIGILQKGTGEFVTDEAGVDHEIKEPIAGYHANMKCIAEIKALIPAAIQIPEPTNKQRRWAGEE